MTYPSFSVGEVLTANDMNAVGLWLVKTQTVGTAVSSVTVSSAFSSNYDAYKIIYEGGTGSTAVQLQLELGTANTGYNYVLTHAAYGVNTVNISSASGTSSFQNIGYMTTNTTILVTDLINPFKAKYTQVIGGSWMYATGTSISYMGEHQLATSYSAFTIRPGSGTLTGGTIRVYGYRN